MKGNEGDESYSHEEHGVLGLGLVLGDHGAADGHDGGNDAVDALDGLSLAGLRLPAGSWATATLAAIHRPWSALVSSVGFRTRGPDAREDSELCAIGDAQLAKDLLDKHFDRTLADAECASDDLVRLTLTQ